MAETWIVVADAHVARFFCADSPLAELRETADLVHPRARLAAREIDSDRPGRTFSSAGGGLHRMVAETDPHRTELARFAREIAAELEAARTRGRLERLMLVVEPKLLGELRDCLGAEIRRIVVFELNKNLVHETPAAIRSRLPQPLWSAL